MSKIVVVLRLVVVVLWLIPSAILSLLVLAFRGALRFDRWVLSWVFDDEISSPKGSNPPPKSKYKCYRAPSRPARSS